VPNGDVVQQARLAELLARNSGAEDSLYAVGVSGSASTGDEVIDELAEALQVASALFNGKSEAEIVETVLALDEGCVAAGGRTVAQERMLGVISEAGGVRVVLTADNAMSVSDSH